MDTLKLKFDNSILQDMIKLQSRTDKRQFILNVDKCVILSRTNIQVDKSYSYLKIGGTILYVR